MFHTERDRLRKFQDNSPHLTPYGLDGPELATHADSAPQKNVV